MYKFSQRIVLVFYLELHNESSGDSPWLLYCILRSPASMRKLRVFIEARAECSLYPTLRVKGGTFIRYIGQKLTLAFRCNVLGKMFDTMDKPSVHERHRQFL